MNAKILMPALFIGHGSPFLIKSENPFTPLWENEAKKIPTPKQIVVISAHWIRDQREITDGEKQKQIYDFYGFPEELYRVKYQANGHPEFAKEISERLPDSKLASCWGLDHGAWCVLSKMYPEANIPVIQISLKRDDHVESLMELGKTLAPLRREDVLFIMSGNIVHNLRAVQFEANAETPKWASDFEKQVSELFVAKNFEALGEFVRTSPLTHTAHPSLEHLAPLFVLAGMTQESDQVDSFARNFDLGTIAMSSFNVHSNP